MGNWNLPTLPSLYADVISILKSRDVDAGTLCKTIPTNPPDGMIAFERAEFAFYEYDLDVDQWVPWLLGIAGGGTGSNTAAGARASLGIGTMGVQASNNVNITGGTLAGLTSLTSTGNVRTTGGQFVGNGGGLTSIPNGATTATNLNTPSAIVARDASGNFVAGTITASLTGNCSGNAGTVTNGVYTTGTYTDPTWLSTLAATKLIGTLADARLSANVPLLNALANVFTGKITASAQPMHKAYCVTQSIPNTTETEVLWGVHVINSGHNLVQLASENALLWITATGYGLYRVTAQITFLAGAGTIRKVILYIGGNPIARAEAVPSATQPTVLNFSALYKYTAGNPSGKIVAYHDSGGDLSVYGADESNSFVEIVKEW